jgi:hypothetical protein
MKGCADNVKINYFTRSRISTLVSIIMLAIVLILLIVPVYILFHLTDGKPDAPGMERVCIAVLVVSTLVFSAGVKLFSSELKRFHLRLKRSTSRRGSSRRVEEDLFRSKSISV